MIKNKKMIKKMETMFEINLFPYEKQFLDTLIEAEKRKKKILFFFDKKSSHSCSRCLLIYSLYKESKMLEKTILNGTSQNTPKGLYDAIKMGGDEE